MPEATIEEVKNLVMKQGQIWEAFKSENDARLKTIEQKGAADPLLEQKLKQINEALDGVQQQLLTANADTKSQLEEIEKLAARPRGNGVEAEDPLAVEHQKAFVHYLKSGDLGGITEMRAKEVPGLERKDGMTVIGDTTGGYFVPRVVADRIVTKVFETTPMRKYATIMTTSSDSLEFPSDPSDVDGGWVGETEDHPVTAGVQPGMNNIPVCELFSQPKLTQKLLDDNSFNLETYLANRIADKFSRLENTSFINGAGVKRPRGILSYNVSANDDDSRPWGTVQVLGTGNNANFNSTNPADILFDIIGKLKAPLLSGSVWFMSRAVVAKIRQMKTTQGYLWQPALTAGVPAELLGFPVEYAQDMPVLAAGSLSVAFGNFREAYTIVDRMGIRTLRDPYTTKGFVKFYTTKRVGGGMVNSEAYKLIQFS